MAQEVELKYLLDADQVDPFLAWPPLQAAQPSSKRVISTYFDTPDATLKQQSVAYRIRQVGETWLQTVKGDAPSVAGLSTREELETPLPSDKPDFAAFVGSPFEPLFSDPLLTENLQPLFITDFERTKWLLNVGTSQVEVVLDRGWVIAGADQSPILEIEMELVDGSQQDLTSLGQSLLDELPLTPGNESKAKRGYRLAGVM